MRSDNECTVVCVVKVVRCLFLMSYKTIPYNAKITGREVKLKEKNHPEQSHRTQHLDKLEHALHQCQSQNWKQTSMTSWCDIISSVSPNHHESLACKK